MTTVERLTMAAGAEEPVSSADVMAYGRITDPAEEPMVVSLITAAREELERLTGRIVVPGTFAVETDTWVSRVDLPLAPVVSIDAVTWVTVDDLLPPVAMAAVDALGQSVAYQATPGGAREVSDSHADYFVRNLTATRSSGAASRVPVARSSTDGAAVLVRIEVTAGYATPDAVPAGIRHYVRTLALLRYQHRDDPEALARAQLFAESGVTSFGVVQA